MGNLRKSGRTECPSRRNRGGRKRNTAKRLRPRILCAERADTSHPNKIPAARSAKPPAADRRAEAERLDS